MDTLNKTLTKAYSIIEESGQPLTPETTCIQCIFLSPDFIQKFDDDTLYLAFIRNLMQERFNVSFPEDISAYEQYFSDCTALKNQQKASGNFNTEHWLSCTTRLLEALKTPYYSVFSCAMLTFDDCFSDKDIFEKVLNSFYSVIIKSNPEKLELIHDIIGHAPSYKSFPVFSGKCAQEQLYADILTDTLAVFGSEKEYWLSSVASLIYSENYREGKVHTQALLQDFFKKEAEFAGEFSKDFSEKTLTDSLNQAENAQETKLTLAVWLSARNLWFSSHKKSPEESILFSGSFYKNPKKISSEFLNTFAYDMAETNYIVNPAIGREQEISDLELILISPKKSPVLTGEAGVGKTSVVEGLAWLLKQGDVPDLLKEKRLYKLTTTSLLSGTKYVGEMEERIRRLTEELKKHPEIILFIDEIHTIVGAGSTESSNNDISNMLKPCIDRGEIKIIGATTTGEYERFILPDRALARRFYPITIEEPDEELTLSILSGSIPAIEYETKVKNIFSAEQTEYILKELIRISRTENQPDYLMTRRPELPLSLLEMAFSYTALKRRNILSTEDIALAVRHSNRLKKEFREKFTI